MSCRTTASRFMYAVMTAAVIALSAGVALHAGTVPLTVGPVSLSPDPVINPSPGSVTVSAAVTATFTPSSGPTLTTTCTGKTKKDETTTVDVSSSLAVTAFDGTNSAALAGVNTGTFAGSLPVGAEGKTNVAVTAAASEIVTTTTITTTTVWSTVGCTGSITSGPTTTTTVSGTSNSSSKNSSASYLVDLVSGALSVVNDQAPTVHQGGHEVVHTVITGGSAGTAYTLNDYATGPDPYNTNVYTATTTDTFGPSPDGIAPNKNNVLGIAVACDAPLGTYQITSDASTVDLGNQPYSPLTATGGTFVVTPGIFLSSATGVVSQLTNGDYGIDACFNSSANARGKLTSNPGSVHITATIDTTGPCAGFATYVPGQVVLTLPAGFIFADTGKSPTAHVFIGTGSLDLHNPTESPAWSEVTGLIQTVSGLTDTIDLSSLGSIPSSTTIYVRAHAVYAGPGVAPADSVFTFSSSANGVGSGDVPLADATTYSIVANPTTAVCTDGHF
jgi:hypothetical protein